MWMIPLLSKSRKPAATHLSTDVASRKVLDRHGASTVSKYKITSLIAHGMRITGHVAVDESLMVLGTIEGDVEVVGKNMVLMSKSGSLIQGSASASIVLVAGEVLGNVVGQVVRLYGTAVVHGSIRASRLIIDDGAIVMNQAMRIGSADDCEGSSDAPISPDGKVSLLTPKDRVRFIQAKACVR